MVDSFLSQTYENRELLLIADNPAHVTQLFDDLFGMPLAHPVESFSFGISDGPQGAKPVHCVAATGHVGAKRNMGCLRARGEFIAHFDDDDYSAPGRLADQVARLKETGMDLTGYSQMKFTDGAHWWRYVALPDYPLGASICYRRAWWMLNRFPENVTVGSDSVLIDAAIQRGRVAVVPCRDMMFASVHNDNMNLRSYTLPTFEELPAEEAIAA